MNKLTATLIASLAFSTMANAYIPCNGLEFKIENKLTDDLLITAIKLNGADILPSGPGKLDSGAEQVFTVNNSTDNTPMTGEFTFVNSKSPDKTAIIKFNLANKVSYCEHSDISPASDYAVKEGQRLPGKVTYSINNK